MEGLEIDIVNRYNRRSLNMPLIHYMNAIGNKIKLLYPNFVFDFLYENESYNVFSYSLNINIPKIHLDNVKWESQEIDIFPIEELNTLKKESDTKYMTFEYFELEYEQKVKFPSCFGATLELLKILQERNIILFHYEINITREYPDSKMMDYDIIFNLNGICYFKVKSQANIK